MCARASSFAKRILGSTMPRLARFGKSTPRWSDTLAHRSRTTESLMVVLFRSDDRDMLCWLVLVKNLFQYIRACIADPGVLAKNVTEDELCKHLTFIKEEAYLICDKLTRESGRLTKLIVVFDMKVPWFILFIS